MSGHVFVVASGFGKRVIPTAAPVQFELGPMGSLRVTIDDRSVIVPSVQGPTDTPSTIADVVAGPIWPNWWLETTQYRLPLPAGWVAYASGGTAPSAFDLLGPQRSLIFVQTPRHVPPVEQFVAPGQTLLERASIPRAEVITVGYFDQEIEYRQRHAVVPLGDLTVVVTLQTVAPSFHLVSTTFDFIAASIQRGHQESSAS